MSPQGPRVPWFADHTRPERTRPWRSRLCCSTPAAAGPSPSGQWDHSGAPRAASWRSCMEKSRADKRQPRTVRRARALGGSAATSGRSCRGRDRANSWSALPPAPPRREGKRFRNVLVQRFVRAGSRCWLGCNGDRGRALGVSFFDNPDEPGECLSKISRGVAKYLRSLSLK